jgi:hypothetical protein
MWKTGLGWVNYVRETAQIRIEKPILLISSCSSSANSSPNYTPTQQTITSY